MERFRTDGFFSFLVDGGEGGGNAVWIRMPLERHAQIVSPK